MEAVRRGVGAGCGISAGLGSDDRRSAQSMVEDRRTDLALEEIEQLASEDGDVWWNE